MYLDTVEVKMYLDILEEKMQLKEEEVRGILQTGMMAMQP